MQATYRLVYASSYQKLYRGRSSPATGKNKWSTTLDELDAFISILYTRDVYGLNNVELVSLWSVVWDPPCFHEPYITTDEQLFPSIVKCRFSQYMPSKPDKFGIKFWFAADVDSKYMLNGFRAS
ncbi:DDE_Tnp_1_7 domain-containing protein [Trichonephila clavipes]|nr:DDE_Tnp_1_7 domain-containing protein [Trichonephila clavipes]